MASLICNLTIHYRVDWPMRAKLLRAFSNVKYLSDWPMSQCEPNYCELFDTYHFFTIAQAIKLSTRATTHNLLHLPSTVSTQPNPILAQLSHLSTILNFKHLNKSASLAVADGRFIHHGSAAHTGGNKTVTQRSCGLSGSHSQLPLSHWSLCKLRILLAMVPCR